MPSGWVIKKSISPHVALPRLYEPHVSIMSPLFKLNAASLNYTFRENELNKILNSSANKIKLSKKVQYFQFRLLRYAASSAENLHSVSIQSFGTELNLPLCADHPE